MISSFTDSMIMTSMSESIHDRRIIAPQVISIRADSDIIAARMTARDLARSMGFSAIDQARIATATSELARNILLYASEGIVTVCQLRDDERFGIELVFEDQGPGIGDVDHLFEDESTTTHPIGMGLRGTRRLMDEMTVETVVGSGTKITCRKWR